MYPGGVEELHEIRITNDALFIGALATMRRMAETLSPYPEFRAIADACSQAVSPQIRNRATVAGNLCTLP